MELLVDSCGLGSDSLHAGVPFNSKVDLVIISKEFGLIVGLKISKDPKISEEKKLLDARKHFLDLTMEFGEISVSPLFILEDDKKSVISDKYKNYVVANEDTKKGNWVRDLIDPMQSPLTVEVFKDLSVRYFLRLYICLLEIFLMTMPKLMIDDEFNLIMNKHRLQDCQSTNFCKLQEVLELEKLLFLSRAFNISWLVIGPGKFSFFAIPTLSNAIFKNWFRMILVWT